MPYIVEMTNPEGGKEYLPESFGHGAHAHTENKSEAERHDTEESARDSVMRYWSPPAFWDSERAHAQRMADRFKGWRYEVQRLAI